MDGYHIYEQIGTGTRSTVYKARKKKSLEFCAVKRTPRAHVTPLETTIMRETMTQQLAYNSSSSRNHHHHSSSNSHDHAAAAAAAAATIILNTNILRLHAWYTTPRHVYRVLEYCAGGDLSRLIAQDHGAPEAATRLFGFDLVAGLFNAHAAGVLLCNLTPSGVLLDENGTLKIADFSAAQVCNDPTQPPALGGKMRIHVPPLTSGGAAEGGKSSSSSSSSSAANTITGSSFPFSPLMLASQTDLNVSYMAPELFVRRRRNTNINTSSSFSSFSSSSIATCIPDLPIHTRASDLWSLGVTLYEIATGKRPFTGTKIMTSTTTNTSHTDDDDDDDADNGIYSNISSPEGILMYNIVHAHIPKEIYLPSLNNTGKEATLLKNNDGEEWGRGGEGEGEGEGKQEDEHTNLDTSTDSSGGGSSSGVAITRASPVLEDLLHRLLEKDPLRRMTWPQLLAHPFWTTGSINSSFMSNKSICAEFMAFLTPLVLLEARSFTAGSREEAAAEEVEAIEKIVRDETNLEALLHRYLPQEVHVLSDSGKGSATSAHVKSTTVEENTTEGASNNKTVVISTSNTQTEHPLLSAPSSYSAPAYETASALRTIHEANSRAETSISTGNDTASSGGGGGGVVIDDADDADATYNNDYDGKHDETTNTDGTQNEENIIVSAMPLRYSGTGAQLTTMTTATSSTTHIGNSSSAAGVSGQAIYPVVLPSRSLLKPLYASDSSTDHSTIPIHKEHSVTMSLKKPLSSITATSTSASTSLAKAEQEQKRDEIHEDEDSSTSIPSASSSLHVSSDIISIPSKESFITTNLLPVLLSPTDTIILPIAASTTNNRAPPLRPTLLPFVSIPASDLMKSQPQSEEEAPSSSFSTPIGTSLLQSQLSAIYKTLVFSSSSNTASGSSDHGVQQAALAYIYSLSEEAVLANAVLNSTIATALVKLVQRSESVAVQARAACVLGRLIQRATFLSPSLVYDQGLLNDLIGILKNSSSNSSSNSNNSSVDSSRNNGLNTSSINTSRDTTSSHIQNNSGNNNNKNIHYHLSAASSTSHHSNTTMSSLTGVGHGAGAALQPTSSSSSSSSSTEGDSHTKISLHPTVRQHLVAAICELIFYIATQMHQEAVESLNNELERSGGEESSRTASSSSSQLLLLPPAVELQWYMPSALVPAFLCFHACSTSEADLMIRMQILQCICNIAALAPSTLHALNPTEIETNDIDNDIEDYDVQGARPNQKPDTPSLLALLLHDLSYSLEQEVLHDAESASADDNNDKSTSVVTDSHQTNLNSEKRSAASRSPSMLALFYKTCALQFRAITMLYAAATSSSTALYLVFPTVAAHRSRLLTCLSLVTTLLIQQSVAEHSRTFVSSSPSFSLASGISNGALLATHLCRLVALVLSSGEYEYPHAKSDKDTAITCCTQIMNVCMNALTTTKTSSSISNTSFEAMRRTDHDSHTDPIVLDALASASVLCAWLLRDACDPVDLPSIASCLGTGSATLALLSERNESNIKKYSLRSSTSSTSTTLSASVLDHSNASIDTDRISFRSECANSLLQSTMCAFQVVLHAQINIPLPPPFLLNPSAHSKNKAEGQGGNTAPAFDEDEKDTSQSTTSIVHTWKFSELSGNIETMLLQCADAFTIVPKPALAAAMNTSIVDLLQSAFASQQQERQMMMLQSQQERFDVDEEQSDENNEGDEAGAGNGRHPRRVSSPSHSWIFETSRSLAALCEVTRPLLAAVETALSVVQGDGIEREEEVEEEADIVARKQQQMFLADYTSQMLLPRILTTLPLLEAVDGEERKHVQGRKHNDGTRDTDSSPAPSSRSYVWPVLQLLYQVLHPSHIHLSSATQTRFSGDADTATEKVVATTIGRSVLSSQANSLLGLLKAQEIEGDGTTDSSSSSSLLQEILDGMLIPGLCAIYSHLLPEEESDRFHVTDSSLLLQSSALDLILASLRVRATISSSSSSLREGRHEVTETDGDLSLLYTNMLTSTIAVISSVFSSADASSSPNSSPPLGSGTPSLTASKNHMGLTSLRIFMTLITSHCYSTSATGRIAQQNDKDDNVNLSSSHDWRALVDVGILPALTRCFTWCATHASSSDENSYASDGGGGSSFLIAQAFEALILFSKTVLRDVQMFQQGRLGKGGNENSKEDDVEDLVSAVSSTLSPRTVRSQRQHFYTYHRRQGTVREDKWDFQQFSEEDAKDEENDGNRRWGEEDEEGNISSYSTSNRNNNNDDSFLLNATTDDVNDTTLNESNITADPGIHSAAATRSNKMNEAGRVSRNLDENGHGEEDETIKRRQRPSPQKISHPAAASSTSKDIQSTMMMSAETVAESLASLTPLVFACICSASFFNENQSHEHQQATTPDHKHILLVNHACLFLSVICKLAPIKVGFHALFWSGEAEKLNWNRILTVSLRPEPSSFSSVSSSFVLTQAPSQPILGLLFTLASHKNIQHIFPSSSALVSCLSSLIALCRASSDIAHVIRKYDELDRSSGMYHPLRAGRLQEFLRSLAVPPPLRMSSSSSAAAAAAAAIMSSGGKNAVTIVKVKSKRNSNTIGSVEATGATVVPLKPHGPANTIGAAAAALLAIIR